MQFTMYEMAQQRTNPAISPLLEHASLNFLYRNQSLNNGIDFSTSYFQGIYPKQYSNALRAAFTVTALDDRSGIAGIYRADAVGFGYAMNLKIAESDFLGVGSAINWKNRSVSLGGLTTGTQFVIDRGFISGDQDDPIGDMRSNYFSGDLGIFWEHLDKKNKRLGYFGLAVYDFNRPNASVFNTNGPVLQSWVITTGIRAYKRNRFSLFPELFYTKKGGLNSTIAGFKYSYELSRSRKNPKNLYFSTRYRSGSYLAAGVQFENADLALGCNYSVPVNQNGYGAAFEIGIVLRRLVAPRKYRRKTSWLQYRRRTGSQKSGTDSLDRIDVLAQQVDDNQVEVTEDDSDHMLYVYPGEISHIRDLNVNDTVRFNFPTNGVRLDDQMEEVLDVILLFMAEHDDVQLVLTGHTDDVGKTDYNYRLGQKRAEQVASFLLDRGLGWERMYIESEGEDSPLLPNTTEENRAKNRRVDVSFLVEEY